MKKKILIVEDNPDNRMLLASIIEANTDYDIILAKTGMDVLNLFEENLIEFPDLILLDIRMPDMDGFEIVEKVRENHNSRDIPVIFITGSTQPADRALAFKIHSCDYITKPFHKDEVLARINTRLWTSSAVQQLKLYDAAVEKLNLHLNELNKLLEPEQGQVKAILELMRKNIVSLENMEKMY